MPPSWYQHLTPGRRTGGKESSNDNVRENKQFRDATKGLTKNLRQRMHNNISGKNYTYEELKAYADELLNNQH